MTPGGSQEARKELLMKVRERAAVAWRVTLCAGSPLFLASLVDGWLIRRNMLQRESGAVTGYPEIPALIFGLIGLEGVLVGPMLGVVWARFHLRTTPPRPAFIGLIPIYLAFFLWIALSSLVLLQADMFFGSVGLPPPTRHPWVEILHVLLYAGVIFLLEFLTVSWRGGSDRRDLGILMLVIIGVLLLIGWWGPPGFL